MLVEHGGEDAGREAAMSEAPPYAAFLERTWQALQPSLHEANCLGCEYLEAARLELRLALEDLAADARTDALHRSMVAVDSAAERHPCLGCDPCRPSLLHAELLREQARRSTCEAACDT